MTNKGRDVLEYIKENAVEVWIAYLVALLIVWCIVFWGFEYRSLWFIWTFAALFLFLPFLIMVLSTFWPVLLSFFLLPIIAIQYIFTKDKNTKKDIGGSFKEHASLVWFFVSFIIVMAIFVGFLHYLGHITGCDRIRY